MIELSHVNLEFAGKIILSDISLSIKKGETSLCLSRGRCHCPERLSILRRQRPGHGNPRLDRPRRHRQCAGTDARPRGAVVADRGLPQVSDRLSRALHVASSIALPYIWFRLCHFERQREILYSPLMKTAQLKISTRRT